MGYLLIISVLKIKARSQNRYLTSKEAPQA